MMLKPQVQEHIQHRVHEAMLQRQSLTIVVEETDGEHQVEGRVVGYRPDSDSVQITNVWGRFLIPIQSILRVL
ncbi:hypothetical protein OS242_17345 [Tumebacillus sp. DT12]|uniref:DUF2642 domain-containing protein n=1 Tax=Tumebacillus lacus TaxID=2995335 RepID=A0ABT3X482_9BACL|nr:hypothetical protein [Tumebacillus lacus]MCX7571711.1 hypothetical protein [Tumebacillus lacus]